MAEGTRGSSRINISDLARIFDSLRGLAALLAIISAATLIGINPLLSPFWKGLLYWTLVISSGILFADSAYVVIEVLMERKVRGKRGKAWAYLLPFIAFTGVVLFFAVFFRVYNAMGVMALTILVAGIRYAISGLFRKNVRYRRFEEAYGQQAKAYLFIAGSFMTVIGAIGWVAISSRLGILLFSGLATIVGASLTAGAHRLRQTKLLPVLAVYGIASLISATVESAGYNRSFIEALLTSLIVNASIIVLYVAAGANMQPPKRASTFRRENLAIEIMERGFNIFFVGVIIAAAALSLIMPGMVFLEYMQGGDTASTLVVRNPIISEISKTIKINEGAPAQEGPVTEFFKNMGIQDTLSINPEIFDRLFVIIWRVMGLPFEIGGTALDPGDIVKTMMFVMLALFTFVTVKELGLKTSGKDWLRKAISSLDVPNAVLRRVKGDFEIRAFKNYSIAQAFVRMFNALVNHEKVKDETTRLLSGDESVDAERVRKGTEELLMTANSYSESMYETAQMLFLDYFSTTTKFLMVMIVAVASGAMLQSLGKLPAFTVPLAVVTLSAALLWYNIQLVGKRLYPMFLSILPGGLVQIYSLIFVPEIVKINWLLIIGLGLVSLSLIGAGIVLGVSPLGILVTLAFVIVAYLALQRYVLKNISSWLGALFMVLLFVRLVQSIAMEDIVIAILTPGESGVYMLIPLVFFVLMIHTIVHFSVIFSLVISAKAFKMTPLSIIPPPLREAFKTHRIELSTQEELERIRKGGRELDRLMRAEEKKTEMVLERGRGRLVGLVKKGAASLAGIRKSGVKLKEYIVRDANGIKRKITVMEKNNRVYALDDEGNILMAGEPGTLEKVGIKLFKGMRVLNERFIGSASIRGRGEIVSSSQEMLDALEKFGGVSEGRWSERAFERRLSEVSANVAEGAARDILKSIDGWAALRTSTGDLVTVARDRRKKNRYRLKDDSTGDSIELELPSSDALEEMLNGAKKVSITTSDGRSVTLDVSTATGNSQLRELISKRKIRSLEWGGKRARIADGEVQISGVGKFKLGQLEKFGRISAKIEVDRLGEAIDLNRSRAALSHIRSVAESGDFIRKTFEARGPGGETTVMVTKRGNAFVAVDSDGKEIARAKTVTALMLQLRKRGYMLERSIAREVESIRQASRLDERSYDELKRQGDIREEEIPRKSEEGANREKELFERLFPGRRYDDGAGLEGNLKAALPMVEDVTPVTQALSSALEQERVRVDVSGEFRWVSASSPGGFRKYLGVWKPADGVYSFHFYREGASRAYARIDDDYLVGAGRNMEEAVRKLIDRLRSITKDRAEELAEKLEAAIGREKTRTVGRTSAAVRKEVEPLRAGEDPIEKAQEYLDEISSRNIELVLPVNPIKQAIEGRGRELISIIRGITTDAGTKYLVYKDGVLKREFVVGAGSGFRGLYEYVASHLNFWVLDQEDGGDRARESLLTWLAHSRTGIRKGYVVIRSRLGEGIAYLYSDNGNVRVYSLREGGRWVPIRGTDEEIVRRIMDTFFSRGVGSGRTVEVIVEDINSDEHLKVLELARSADRATINIYFRRRGPFPVEWSNGKFKYRGREYESPEEVVMAVFRDNAITRTISVPLGSCLEMRESIMAGVREASEQFIHLNIEFFAGAVHAGRIEYVPTAGPQGGLVKWMGSHSEEREYDPANLEEMINKICGERVSVNIS